MSAIATISGNAGSTPSIGARPMLFAFARSTAINGPIKFCAATVYRPGNQAADIYRPGKMVGKEFDS